MKIKNKPPLPNVVRLRVDDEEFDAIPLKSGDYKVAEVVLSYLCTDGDVVRADETGRVTTVVKNRFETKITVCGSEQEAEELGKEYVTRRVPFRIEMGNVVLAATPIEAPFDHGNYIDPIHEKEEYDYAWDCIKREFGDFDCEHGGEMWQYMGAQGEHCFRHRNLPRSKGYTYRYYPYSEGWKAKRPVPDGRMLRAKYGIYEVGVYGESRYQEDGLTKEFLKLNDHDSVRVRRHVFKNLGSDRLKNRDVLRCPEGWETLRYGEWATEIVQDMLAATLTKESELEVEYLDR